MSRNRNVRTVVYIGHFSDRYRHARHYLGVASDEQNRWALHDRGQSGVKLIQAAVGAGITFEWHIIAEFDNKDAAYTEEIKLKKQGSRARQCPVCRAQSHLERMAQDG